MGVFDFLRGGKLQPIWRYTARGVIWRVTPAPGAKLVGEERDIEKKETRFFCLNQLTGKVLWDRRTFDEKWWIGVEAVHRDVVFVHHFATPDLPEHKAIIAVDLPTGKELWSNEALTFIVALDDSVFASKKTLEGKVFIELHFRTGTMQRSWGTDEQIVQEAKNRAATQVENDTMELPVPLDQFSRDNADLVAMVERHLSLEKITGPIGVLKYGTVIAISFHENVGTGEKTLLNNILTLLDKRTGTAIFNEILNMNSPAIAPESFFAQHGMLYFIKELKTLTALKIPDPSSTPKSS